jgi:sugar phosphate isomerase/epimerase
MNLGSGLGHLSYSTLVHPGDTWEDMQSSLATYLPQLKARLSPDEPFGLSLRLSAQSAQTLIESTEARAKLKEFLLAEGLYLYTANAFVYGGFRGEMVKERVYEPDWQTEERVRYTLNVAELLAQLASDGVNPSIQTPPLAFKPRVTGPDATRKFTDNLLQVVTVLVDIERRTGVTVTLAIEPEPRCFLETTDETVRYFSEHLYSSWSAQELARQAGLALSEAHGALRRHVGVVYDVCHQAVAYESPSDVITKLADAGIPIFKLQLAAALRIPTVRSEDIERLRRFADSIYLTQTVERRGAQLTHFLNIEEACAAWSPSSDLTEWRIHFHVPIFLEALGELQTTRFAIEEALRLHKAAPLTRQLEVETYTWDVLPDEFKTGSIVDYVTRELEWVRSEVIGRSGTEETDPFAAGTTARQLEDSVRERV